MTMKVVFENHSLRLLGAQIIGSDGVDKRIDVLATAIASGVRADRLKELELAYAPPFSSAKDPVNMAGFMIENIGKPVYLICQSGLRSYIAYRILMQHGFDCYNFAGGYRFYASVTGEIKMSERACACGMDR